MNVVQVLSLIYANHSTETGGTSTGQLQFYTSINQVGSQAKVTNHTANNKSYQFQASIVTEDILSHDVHGLP